MMGPEHPAVRLKAWMQYVLLKGVAHHDEEAKAVKKHQLEKAVVEPDSAAPSQAIESTPGDQAEEDVGYAGIQISKVAEMDDGPTITKPFAGPGTAFCKKCEMNWADTASSPLDGKCPVCDDNIFVFKAMTMHAVEAEQSEKHGLKPLSVPTER